MSARFPPEDDREKRGCAGRLMARDCLDPDIERTWLLLKAPALPLVEFDLFIADAGCGIAELRLRPPRVCALGTNVSQTFNHDVGGIARMSERVVPLEVFGRSKDPVPAT
jgi:hypothetical protein